MQKKFKVIDPIGLHARPATMLVNEASKFASESKITSHKHSANLKSIMGVMSLGLMTHHEFTIECSGRDEAEAMRAMVYIIESINIAEAI